MGAVEPDAGRVGHHRHAVDPQTARELLAGLADPRPRPPHPRPEAARRAPPLQRKLHAARLDVTVLSAVRLARRRRPDDEGPLRRGAVGRHDPSRHRAAQEDPRDAPRIRGEGANPERRWFFEPFVPDRVAIPDVSRPGAAHNVAWETLSTDELATNPALWQLAPQRHLARLPRHGRRFCHDRPEQADLAHPRLRPHHRHLCRARHPRAGRRAISAREPHRRREERPPTPCSSC